MYGSISEPISTSPRSVWLMYTCSAADTMITCRNGLSGSVTKAWSTCVVIGSSTPAIAATWLDQPATQATTDRVAMSPRFVFDAGDRSPSRSIAVTSV